MINRISFLIFFHLLFLSLALQIFEGFANLIDIVTNGLAGTAPSNSA